MPRYTGAMKVGARLGLGQVAIFVTLAVILNAQFTWWVVYSLRENREGLALQRALLVGRAEAAALRLELRAEEAALRIVTLSPGIIPPAQEPFVEVRVIERRTDQAPGWSWEEGRAALTWSLGRGHSAVAVLPADAAYRWLDGIDPTLRLVPREGSVLDLPRVALSAPFDRLAVSPDVGEWRQMLASYRRRIVLVVVEGVFFVAAMVSAVWLLWTVLHREGQRERQHENFVSAVTHELKTPLAGIRLALETVLSGRVDGDGTRRFLTNALADADRLAGLVEKILEVTRYTGGAHRLRLEHGDLSQLVESEVAAAERRAAARGAVLESELAQGVQAPFDAEALAIVLSNLLENALKYAQGPPPTVHVRLALERGEAVIEVRDNGVGIAAEELEAVFRPFYRSSDEVTRRTPGTGIGLFVAREIMTAHGGRLMARSEGRGRGATFRLVLPGASALAEGEFSEYDGADSAR